MVKQVVPQLPGFKQVLPINVKWGDMDAMRHVNNTRYFYYAESARLDFILKMFPDLSAIGQDRMPEGIALAYADCKFKVSLTYPDQVLVGSIVTQIKETEFCISHHMYSTKLACVAAESTARMVYYDFERGERKALSDEMLVTLKQYYLCES